MKIELDVLLLFIIYPKIIKKWGAENLIESYLKSSTPFNLQKRSIN